MIVETFGQATLYLGDAREIVPTLGPIEALIGDPPYGQRHNTNVARRGGGRYYGGGLPKQGQRSLETNRRAITGSYHGGVAMVWPAAIEGDDEDFDPTPWLAVADNVLLWGAHRFANRLPPGSWLVWDKVPNGKVRDQGDGEAAWLKGPVRPLRIYRLLWDGVCVGSAARHEVTAGQSRVHPMQKPEAVMSWCISQAKLRPGVTILDPWMGAGSTGVAALRAGHPFIGVELVPLFFETACRRIETAQRQGDMLLEAL